MLNIQSINFFFLSQLELGTSWLYIDVEIQNHSQSWNICIFLRRDFISVLNN